MVETKPEGPKTSADGGDHEPHFEPVVNLPLQEVQTLEENETELFKMRAKLYRWASECDPAEWKERGTGEVKLLQHEETSKVRLLMRRDKTLKVCANHFVEEYMKLTPNCGSDRAWVWNVGADFSDEEAKSELLAIKFLNAENANKFKDMFEKSIEINKNLQKDETSDSETKEKEKNPMERRVESTAENLEALKIESGEASKEDEEKRNPTQQQPSDLGEKDSEKKTAEENAGSDGSPEK